jgi:NAD-dependent SIR2 family protein deacetylase
VTDVGPPVLGDCPNCGESVTEPWLLIEYEREDGDPGRYAECPACGDVVRPR